VAEAKAAATTSEWIGGRFDADEFDLAAVNDALKDFA
jgi:hypothetical protein